MRGSDFSIGWRYEGDCRIVSASGEPHPRQVRIRDQIVPILSLLQTTESHLGPGDVLLRIFEVLKLQTWVSDA